MTIREAFENFIQDKQLYGLSQRTMEAYQSFIAPFVAFADASCSMENLTNKTIKDYMATLYARKLSKATIATYIRHIKVFLTWYQIENTTAYNVKTIPMPRVPKKNVHQYTDDEIQLIFSSIEAKPEWIALRNRSAVALMLDSGLRRNEVCTIEIDKLDMETGLLTVIGKGEKERTVHVGQLSMQFIQAYINTCPFRTTKYLFVDKLGNPMSNNALKLMMEKLSNKLPFELSCHKLRHNFATNYCLDMYEEKGHMDAYSLQILLGHAEIETTMRYIHHATQITASRASISHLDKLMIPCKS